MTPRKLTRMRRFAAPLLVFCGLVGIAGCDPRTLLYFLQPFEPTIPAPGPPLKGKKVAVVTAASPNCQAEFANLDRDLNREFVANLKKKAKKVELVESEKISTWIEGHPRWTDPSDIARDFEADMVIFMELEQFQIQNPGDLNVLQGSSKVHIKVVELTAPKNSKGKPILDQPKESSNVYDDYQESIFPIRGPIEMGSGVGRSAFKTKFLQVVAAECSWHFVEHTTGDAVQDVRFNQR